MSGTLAEEKEETSVIRQHVRVQYIIGTEALWLHSWLPVVVVCTSLSIVATVNSNRLHYHEIVLISFHLLICIIVLANA